MNTQPADIENSIRLALEAAETATESAEEVSRLGAATQKAADKLEAFSKVIKPVALGCLAGSVLSVALAGLVYVRTLSEMRAATATQIEALAVFSTSLEELRSQIEGIGASSQDLENYASAQAAGQKETMDALARLQDSILLQVEGLETGEDTQALPQLLRGVTDAIQKAHVETRENFTGGLSDLQLAMTRMLADELAQQSARTTAPQATPRPAPARTTPARPPVNPLKFP